MMQVKNEKNHLKRRSHRLRRAWGMLMKLLKVAGVKHLNRQDYGISLVVVLGWM